MKCSGATRVGRGHVNTHTDPKSITQSTRALNTIQKLGKQHFLNRQSQSGPKKGHRKMR